MFSRVRLITIKIVCRSVDLGMFCLSQSTLSDVMGKVKDLCVRPRQAAWFILHVGLKKGERRNKGIGMGGGGYMGLYLQGF